MDWPDTRQPPLPPPSNFFLETCTKNRKNLHFVKWQIHPFISKGTINSAPVKYLLHWVPSVDLSHEKLYYQIDTHD